MLKIIEHTNKDDVHKFLVEFADGTRQWFAGEVEIRIWEGKKRISFDLNSIGSPYASVYPFLENREEKERDKYADRYGERTDPKPETWEG